MVFSALQSVLTQHGVQAEFEKDVRLRPILVAKKGTDALVTAQIGESLYLVWRKQDTETYYGVYGVTTFFNDIVPTVLDEKYDIVYFVDDIAEYLEEEEEE